MALTTRKSAFANPSKVTRQQIPPFLDKLYHMVNDPSTDSLIRWSDAGDSFYVQDPERFAKEVLPHWFKHGKMGSFVRQLNNYGFHKVPNLQQGVLRSDGETEISHFENANFQRGQPDLLCLIQRKKAPGDTREESPDIKEPVASMTTQSNGAESESTHGSHNIKGAVLDVNGIVNGIQAIKRHQHAISSELKELHQSNQGLWQEAYAARERHKKHHDTITRILKFLAGIFGQTQAGSGPPHAQEVPRDAAGESSNSTAIVPRRHNRLMIGNGVDLEGRATEVLNGMHLNMDDFMEPLDFEGGQANDAERFATIETPGSPGPSTPAYEPLPTPSNAPSPQSLRNVSVNQNALASSSSLAVPSSQAVNTAALPTYSYPPLNHDRPSPLGEPTSSFVPDLLFPSDTSSAALTTNANDQSDQMVQNAFSSLINNPAQLQRVLAALQSQLPMTMPPDPGPDVANISRDTVPSPPPFNLRTPADGQLSPNSTLSLLSAASNMGALSSFHSTDDASTFGALAQNANQLQKSYTDAEEVEADVNALQGHIDSLIESFGLDPNTAAALRGDGAKHADDEIVSSISAGLAPPPAPVDGMADLDFDAFFDVGGGMGMNASGFDAVAQQNGADRLGAFLDEVRSVSNGSEVTAGEQGSPVLRPESDVKPPPPVEAQAPVKMEEKPSRKRKSDVADLEDEQKMTKAPRTRKKR